MVSTKKDASVVAASMDQAAREASGALNAAYVDSDDAKKAVDYMAAWWKKHYLKAGHKRLARILLEYTSTKK
ncbi:MAG: hypothetical protein EXR48_04800 [Dehalococcoidia bacterium]|nr:hypothetical protein [Dehalococcoidia bacterium]